MKMMNPLMWCLLKHLTTKQLVEFFKHTDIAIGIIDENDASRESSDKVARGIESALACYKELYRKRQKAARQLSLRHFFKRVEICQSTDSKPSLLQGSQPSLILLHPHQHPVSHLMFYICTFIVK
jgi:hypothetical protein